MPRKGADLKEFTVGVGKIPMAARTAEDVGTFFRAYNQAFRILPGRRHSFKRKLSPRRVHLREALCSVLFIETSTEIVAVQQNDAVSTIDPARVLVCTPEPPAVQLRILISLLKMLGVAMSGPLQAVLARARGAPPPSGTESSPSLFCTGSNRIIELEAMYHAEHCGLEELWMTIDARRQLDKGQPLRQCNVKMRKDKFRYCFRTFSAEEGKPQWKVLQDNSIEDDIWDVVQMALGDLMDAHSPVHLEGRIRYRFGPYEPVRIYMAALRDTL
jgi:hypothetical protein